MNYNINELKQLIAEVLQCNVADINNDSGLNRTYNWDSLNHITILTLIEEKFKIHIADKYFIELITVEKIANFLKIN